MIAKLILGLSLLTTVTAFGAETRITCEATAGVNGNFSSLSKGICNGYKSVDACRGDFRCTPVKSVKVQICKTETSQEDAVTGESLRFLRDGTVTRE